MRDFRITIWIHVVSIVLVILAEHASVQHTVRLPIMKLNGKSWTTEMKTNRRRFMRVAGAGVLATAGVAPTERKREGMSI